MAFHVSAPSGWVNDPNGFCWFAGEYHLFYQHHPFGVEWGPMHWGHVVSPDLVSWRHAGVALAPGEAYDSDGCFSGSAVDNDGELTLIYTGHVHGSTEVAFRQSQNIATSRDGVTFTKDAANPVIPEPPADSTRHFRDPRVWRHEDRWFMVVGNGDLTGNGRALLYTSFDLRQWSGPSVVAESGGPLGWMWECPDLFELQGRAVLLLSPMGLDPVGGAQAPSLRTGSLVGRFDFATHRLSHGDYADLDGGHDFYAAQSMLTPDGRRVLTAWMPARQLGVSEKADGWAGALALPRELTVTDDDRLAMRPVAEAKFLRAGVLLATSVLVDGQFDTGLSDDAVELLLRADLGGSRAREVGLALDDGGAGSLRLVLDRDAGELVLDRGGADGVRRTRLVTDGWLELRVFLDRSSIEVFTPSGSVTMTSRFYPVARPTVRLVCEGGSTRFGVQAYRLRDIWDSRDPS